MIKRLSLLMSSLGGVGWIKGGATVVTALSFWLLYNYREIYSNFISNPQSWLVVSVVVILLGVVISLVDDKYYSKIVIDRVVGAFFSLILVPISWKVALTGFAIYSFFDIVKPWPIYILTNNFFRGASNVSDDILSGLFTTALLLLVIKIYENLMLYL